MPKINLDDVFTVSLDLCLFIFQRQSCSPHWQLYLICWQASARSCDGFILKSSVSRAGNDIYLMLQTKEEIAHDVKEQLTKSMSSFGFMIIQTLVTDIEPDMKVRAAMNEINAAQRMRCLLLSYCARNGNALFRVHSRICQACCPKHGFSFHAACLLS